MNRYFAAISIFAVGLTGMYSSAMKEEYVSEYKEYESEDEEYESEDEEKARKEFNKTMFDRYYGAQGILTSHDRKKVSVGGMQLSFSATPSDTKPFVLVDAPLPMKKGWVEPLNTIPLPMKKGWVEPLNTIPFHLEEQVSNSINSNNCKELKDLLSRGVSAHAKLKGDSLIGTANKTSEKSRIKLVSLLLNHGAMLAQKEEAAYFQDLLSSLCTTSLFWVSCRSELDDSSLDHERRLLSHPNAFGIGQMIWDAPVEKLSNLEDLKNKHFCRAALFWRDHKSKPCDKVRLEYPLDVFTDEEIENVKKMVVESLEGKPTCEELFDKAMDELALNKHYSFRKKIKYSDLK